MKQKIGSAAYSIQTVIEVAKSRQEKFDILIDKQSFLKENNDDKSQDEMV